MKKTALTIAIAVAGLGSAGVEAQASTKKCPQGALCLWAKENYTGKKTVIKEPGTSNLAKKVNNTASSVKSRYSNSNGDRTYLFDKRNGEGNYFCLGAGLTRKLPTMGPPYNFDNATTSVLLPKGDNGPLCL